MDNAFLDRKTGGGSKYNYDLEPLISNFTFYDFVTKIESSEEHGAFLVITNNQYIIGYNAGFGAGTHLSAFARTEQDINDNSKSSINNDQDAIRLSRKCATNYITARIIFERTGENNYGRPTYSGYIHFNLKEFGGKITPSQFEMFKEFYEDYNEDIKYITARYNFIVSINYVDSNKKSIRKEAKDLDELYNYLEQNIDNNKVIEEEKIIIGKERKSRKNK